MLCLWLMLMCCSMAYGQLTCGWMHEIRKTYAAWNTADNSQNITGLMGLVDTHVTFFPPGLPPIRGKAALTRFYEHKLADGKWPVSKTLKLTKIIATCDNIAVAEHKAKMITFDGRLYRGSGEWLFSRHGNEVKLLSVSWSSDD